MTNRSVGQTKTKDPRRWRVGKHYKGKKRRGSCWDSTIRYLRRQAKVELRKEMADGES